MFNSIIRRTPRPQDIIGMDTQELRDTFQVTGLFEPAELIAHFTDLDRLVVGGGTPADKALELPNHKETGRSFFLERRELGAINIGGAGKVTADGQTFALEKLDCVYLPMGTKSVSFTSDDPKNPAKFYFLSCPAHAPHPMRMMKSAEASPVHLGAQETSNKRTIYKFIHQGGIQSCQLVMGRPRWNRATSGIPSPHTRTGGGRRSTSTSISVRTSFHISSGNRRRRGICSCTMKMWRFRPTGRCISAWAPAITSSSGAWPVKIRCSTTWTR